MAGLTLSGRLDSAAATEVCHEALAHRQGALCIDLSEVTFIGALPLQALMIAVTEARRDGRRVEVTGASDALAAQLELADMDLRKAEGEPG